jgi:hypothetical protein
MNKMYEYKFYETPKGLKRKKVIEVRWDSKTGKVVPIRVIRIENV